MTTQTHSTKPVSSKDVERKYILIDLSGQILGRIAPTIAKILQGKHKVNYVSYNDMGDYVVAINAKKIVVTGKKDQTKVYTRFSGYPGGLKRISYNTLKKENPTRIIMHAVSGMLPKNKHRDDRMRRLIVFPDADHQYGDKITDFKNQKPNKS